MSYEKLGFTSGQTLKAEHLNHMEEGIANAGGIDYYTGDIQLSESSGSCAFIFTDLTKEVLKQYNEMEVGVMVNDNSRNIPYIKYGFIDPSGIASDNFNDLNGVINYGCYPTPALSWEIGSVKLNLIPSGMTNSIYISNPSIVFVRLYKKV